MNKIRVAVGLSGGVDSAVSAYLLKKQGFDISGVYLRCFDDDAPGCRGKQDRQDALKVAVHLKIPFRALDFRRQYKSAVIAYFKKEYLAGRTPNPDVICNRDIKFGLFLDWAIKEGFDYVATGHYARLRRYSRKSRTSANNHELTKLENFVSADTQSKPKQSQDSVFLTQPKDLHKDQTYFLWAVPRQNFSRVLFPLADFRKQDVRSVAKFAKIPVADKPDSTGICFVGEVRVEDFLKRLGVKEKIGEVVIKATGLRLDARNLKFDKEARGLKVERGDSGQSIFNFPTSSSNFQHPASNIKYEVIGRHRGVWFYTIGQRHGFSVDRWPPKNNSEFRNSELVPDRPPLYVIAKDVRRNRLVVGFGAECYRSQFTVSQINWLMTNDEFRMMNDIQHSTFIIQNFPHAYVRIRHLGELIPCSLSVNSEQLTVNGDSPFTIHDSLLSVHRSRFTVHLRFAQRGVAAGQSAVFYSKNGRVLGGGVIQ